METVAFPPAGWRRCGAEQILGAHPARRLSNHHYTIVVLSFALQLLSLSLLIHTHTHQLPQSQTHTHTIKRTHTHAHTPSPLCTGISLARFLIGPPSRDRHQLTIIRSRAWAGWSSASSSPRPPPCSGSSDRSARPGDAGKTQDYTSGLHRLH